MSSDSIHIDLDQAIGIYEAWQKHAAGKGEKASLKRLYPGERDAMEKIAKFVEAKGISSEGKEADLILETSHTIFLLKRLGIGTDVTRQVFSVEEAKATFQGALSNAGEAIRKDLKYQGELANTPVGLFDREKFFDYLLAEMRKDPKLSDPRVEEVVLSLLMPLRAKFLVKDIFVFKDICREFTDEFEDKIESALKEGVSQKTVQSAAKTIEKLAPIIKRETKISEGVLIAEAFEHRSALTSAFDKMCDEAMRFAVHDRKVLLDLLAFYLKDRGSTIQNLTPQEKAFLSTRWAQEEIGDLIERAKTEPQLDLKKEFGDIVANADRQDWIDRSGLPDPSFTAFCLNLLCSKILRAIIPKTNPSWLEKKADLMETVRLSSFSRLGQRVSFINREQDSLLERIGKEDADFENDLKSYLNHIDRTNRKFTEIVRRISQNLRSPFYQGIYAQALYEHYNFLVKNVAMAEAVQTFLNFPDDKLESGKSIQESLYEGTPPSTILEELREKFSESSKEMLGSIDKWAKSSAAQDSYDGQMVLARRALDEATWLGKPNDPMHTLDELIVKADIAIRSAENRDVSRFASFAPFLRAFGYTSNKPQRERLTRATELKIEIYRTAYLKVLDLMNSSKKRGFSSPPDFKTFADNCLKKMIDTAQEIDEGRSTSLKGMTRELLAAMKMEGNELLGWLFGHDLRNPDFSDRSLQSLSHQFVVGGVREAAKRIFELLRKKAVNEKPLTDMDIQHLMTFAILFKPGYLNGNYLLPKEMQDTIEELLGPNPSAKVIGDSYHALRAAAAYLKNRRDQFGKYNLDIDKDLLEIEKKVEGLLEQTTLDDRYFIEKAIGEVTNPQRKGSFEDPFQNAVGRCRENPKIGAYYLLQLIDIGETEVLSSAEALGPLANARNVFIEVMGKKEAASWTSEELQGIVAIALMGSEGAKELLLDNAELYPHAARFVADPVLAIAETPTTSKTDLGRSDMKDILSHVANRMRVDSGLQPEVMDEQLKGRLEANESQVRTFEYEMRNLGANIRNFPGNYDALLFFLYRAYADVKETEKDLATKALQAYVKQSKSDDVLSFQEAMTKIAEAETRLNIHLGAKVKLPAWRVP